jgi:transcriptional regulator with XRE-family HTH domain
MTVVVFDGAEIKRVRKAKGLSLEQLAKVLGASKFAISRWENGKARPNELAARRLVTWLGQGAPGARSARDGQDMSEDMSVEEWRASTPSITIKVPMKLTKAAADYGLDVVRLFETVGTDAVWSSFEEEWKNRNAAAIRHNNEELERAGLWSDGYRLF